MTRVHAFADDALADLDAAGLVEALQGRRRVGPRGGRGGDRPHRAGRRRAGRGRRYAAFDRARAEARDPRRRLLRRRARPSSRTTSTSPACRPSRAPTPSRPAGQRATATSRGCTSRPAWSRSARPSSPSSASAPRPTTRGSGRSARPWDTSTTTAGASSAGVGRARRRRCRPDRPRQRRRRLDPDPGRGQRAGRAQADPRPARPGQGDARQMPVRIVSDGVLTRTVRDTAAFFREAEKVYRDPRLPPIGDITRPGPGAPPDRRRHRAASGATRTPEVRELTLQDRRAARGARPPRRGGRRPRCRPRSPTTSSSTGRCWRSSIVRTGRSATARPGTRTGSTT